MTRDAELPAREYVELAIRHAAREPKASLVQTLVGQAFAAINAYGDPANAPRALDSVAQAALAELDAAEAGSDHQLLWCRALAVAARSEDHLRLVEAMLDGSLEYEGLAVDTELRWHLLRALAASAARGGRDLGRAASGRDGRRPPPGRGARASPSHDRGQGRGVGAIVRGPRVPPGPSPPMMAGFQQPGPGAPARALRGRFFESLGTVWAEREFRFSLDFGEAMFPRWIVGEDTVELVDRALDRGDLPGPLRRLLLEGKDRLLRALRARRVDAQSAPR